MVITATKLRTAAIWRHQTTNVTSTTFAYTTPTDNSNNNSNCNVSRITTTAGQEKTSAEMSSKEVALTRMLIATSVCRLHAPIFDASSWNLLHLRYGGRYHNTITVLWMLVSFCRVLNSAAWCQTYAGSSSLPMHQNTSMTTSPVRFDEFVTTAGDQEALTAEGCFIVQQGDYVPWNNPDNLISQEVTSMLFFLFNTFFIPIFCLVGIFGNILCAIVFYRQGLRDRINLCLFSLAVVDGALVTVILHLHAEDASRAQGGESFIFVSHLVGFQGFTFASQFLSAVIASERCFCVVSPFKAKEVLKTSTMAVIIILVSTVLVAGYVATIGFKHTSACIFDPATNATSLIVYVTEFYLNNQEILDIIDVFVYSTAFPAFFIIVIIITTTITAIKLRTAATWRRQTANVTTTITPTPTTTTAAGQRTSAEMSSKEVALTRMLIATSVLFVVCTLPVLVVQIAIFTVPELRHGGRYHNMIVTSWTLISFLKVINSSFNFCIYLYMGLKFRETVKELFPCCRGKSVKSAYMPKSETSVSTVA